ncbi:hypothetical protein ACH42_03895 [Endozoicomonas sp. (ex Bugula neritina AB1)]|nr:hypothetical protein ACH42_03895 [Endozoicomonas sp. (ex Bugula neritina AB1)]
MPHCIIEYSKTLEQWIHPKDLIDTVQRETFQSGLFKKEDIKSRCLPFEYYEINDSSDHFIHIQLKIFSGRTTDQKKALSSRVVSGLATLKLTGTLITCEVTDIDTASYLKHRLY